MTADRKMEEEEVPSGLRVVSLLPSATEIVGVLGLEAWPYTL